LGVQVPRALREALQRSNDEKVDDVADGNAVQDRRDSRGDDRGRTSPATFLRQVVAELRKVVWPTQQQLITYFFVVLVFVIVLMILVTVLDLAFGKLVFELFTGGSSVQ
jgi:preprotein translocase subunit SecE